MNDGIVAAALCFWVACLLPGTCARAGEGGVSAHGALKVAGARLVDSRGEPVQLRGMSSHGLQWYPEYTGFATMRDLGERGANLFRFAMYADSNLGGYNDGERWKRINGKLLRLGVENAIAADMYAIVDWHLLEDKNPLNTVESAEKFFDEISSLYGDNPAIIYEICNEPNGGTTWADIAAYAARVIPVIRKNAPNAVVLVGSPEYASRILDAAAAPLPFGNVMYTFHYYTGFSGMAPAETIDAALEAGLPVFVSEWGMNDGGRSDAEPALAFIEYMAEKGISWANWSLCNKDEGFSAIRSGVTKLAGWTPEDLTESGRIVFSAFTGSPASAPEGASGE